MDKENTINAFYTTREEIKQGDERHLHAIYTSYRTKFLNWAQWQYRCDEAVAAEVYQQAFVIFYYNIKNNKIVELTSSLETYLYGIGKNVFRERFKDRYTARVVELDDRLDWGETDNSIADKYHQLHQKQVVKLLLAQLGETCRQILTLYYFKRYSMESIAEAVGYKNELVAKKKKYQCLQGLRSKLEEHPELIEKLLNG